MSDAIINVYLRIPASVRGFVCATILRRPMSTAHLGFGGWRNFASAGILWVLNGKKGSP